MIRIPVIAFIFATLSISQAIAQTRDVGTNVAQLAYYSSELPFKDAFKLFGTGTYWLTSDAATLSPWNNNHPVPLTPEGYPTHVPFNVNGVPQVVHHLMLRSIPGYPTGTYRILADGTGTVTLNFDATGTFTFPNPTGYTFNVPVSTSGGINVTITSSDSLDPIHNIRVLLPDYINDTTYITQPFTNEFLAFLDTFSTIRYMPWMNTNYSEMSEWSQRTLPNFNSQTNWNGVAYEYIAHLSNQTSKDAWVCVPHRASDDFIVNFLTFFRDNLNSDVKLYLEYSNECWNAIFPQKDYCDSMGAALGYPGPAWEQGWQFYSKRTADLFHLADSVYGSDITTRVVKALASQFGNPWLCNYQVTAFENPTYNPYSTSMDALAVGAYFGGTLPDSIYAAGTSGSITVDEFLNLVNARVYLDATPNIIANKAVAVAHSVRLIAYESGQHLAPSFAAQSDTALISKIHAVNRDSMMETIYCNFFDEWYNNANDLNVVYTSTFPYTTPYGDWGIMESSWQPLMESPKYRAIVRCASDTTEVIISTESTEVHQGVSLYPNPATNTVTVEMHADTRQGILSVYNVFGQEVLQLDVANSKSISVNVAHLPSGVYTVRTALPSYILKLIVVR